MMGVRMRNWRRRRIWTIFECVRIVGAAFFWYTFTKCTGRDSWIINVGEIFKTLAPNTRVKVLWEGQYERRIFEKY